MVAGFRGSFLTTTACPLRLMLSSSLGTGALGRLTEAVFVGLDSWIACGGDTGGCTTIVFVPTDEAEGALGGGMVTGPLPGMGADWPEWLCVV